MPNFAIQATTPSKTASSPPQPQPTCRINLEAIAARVSALLPQKSDPAKFERILPTLKTPDYRVALTKETRQEITEQRKLLMTEFFEINGSFSADPASQLFIAKRKFIDLEADYNKQAKIPFDRNATSSTSEAMKPIFDAFQTFITLEKRSGTLQQLLCQLGHTVQSDPELLHFFNQEKSALTARKTALCGTQPQDPNSILFKAHQNYLWSLKGSPVEASRALVNYYAVQDEKTDIQAKLSLIDQMTPLTADASLSLNSVVSRKIEYAIENLQKQIEKEKSNAGIDWRSTAVYAMHCIVPLVASALHLYSGEELQETSF